MTSMMRPGRGDITTILVDKNTASGIEMRDEDHGLSGLIP
jgi:hypothetical protein